MEVDGRTEGRAEGGVGVVRLGVLVIVAVTVASVRGHRLLALALDGCVVFAQRSQST